MKDGLTFSQSVEPSYPSKNSVCSLLNIVIFAWTGLCALKSLRKG